MTCYIPRWFTHPQAQTVTHPSSNRAQCRLTMLIEANALTTTLRRHPLLTMMSFVVQVRNTKTVTQDIQGEVNVGVSSHGLSIYKERLVIYRWSWQKILHFSYSRGGFTVKIRPKVMCHNSHCSSFIPLTFFGCGGGGAAEEFLKFYMEIWCFFSFG